MAYDPLWYTFWFLVGKNANFVHFSCHFETLNSWKRILLVSKGFTHVKKLCYIEQRNQKYLLILNCLTNNFAAKWLTVFLADLNLEETDSYLPRDSISWYWDTDELVLSYTQWMIKVKLSSIFTWFTFEPLGTLLRTL